MRGVTTPAKIITQIISSRKRGMSILEISSLTGKSKSVVSRYVQGVIIPTRSAEILKQKNNYGKIKAQQSWAKAANDAKGLIGQITKRDKMLILASLYWGEGTKTELNIINSDLVMLKVFISCIQDIGVLQSDIIASIRLFDGMDKKNAISYWSKNLDLPTSQFRNIEMVKGNKKNKLQHGMCRLRVRKGGRYFKLIMSLIGVIKNQADHMSL